jgi:hypothetical protein
MSILLEFPIFETTSVDMKIYLLFWEVGKFNIERVRSKIYIH